LPVALLRCSRARSRVRRVLNDADRVVDLHYEVGSTYSERTIRTHVVSRMNRDRSGLHQAVVYDDLETVGPGRYRRAPPCR